MAAASVTGPDLQNAYALHRSGRLDEAEQLYREVLKVHPRHPDALYLLGMAHAQRGRFSEALSCYDQALAIVPAPEISAARGAVLSRLGRHLEALAAYDRAVALKPDLFTAWSNRGNALLELGRPFDAVASYDKAIGLNPTFPDVWRNRATALLKLGNAEEALKSLDRALRIKPDFLEAMEDRARLLAELHRHAEAADAFACALSLQPENKDLLYGRANALANLKRYDDAIAACQTLLQRDPAYPYARGVLLHCKLQACDWRDLAQHVAAAQDAIARGLPAVSPFNHKALSDSPEAQLACAKGWVAHECPPAPEPLWRNGSLHRHERIRVAYVSADFNNTAVAHAVAGVLEHHDRRRFEVTAVSFGPSDGSPMRTRLERAFEHFLDLCARSDSEIARLIRALEIDVAVDLMGFTGACRSRIFAERPAPLQVNYLGFPGTMGAPYIDYILADSIVIPEAQESFYAEQVVRLPHCYLPADPARLPAPLQPTRSQAGLPEHGFVFCSFNNSYKFSPHLFAVWMRLLHAIKGSVLWLPRNNALAMRNLTREAEAHGIASERLIFAPQCPAPSDHLARLSLADLFLDTFPYNAHSTGMDAIIAGVPILSCRGEAFAGRVGASLLSTVGLPELIVDSFEGYEAAALRLAREPETLTRLRARLMDCRRFPPFDCRGFARHLERAYETMWERLHRGLPPEGFTVED